MRTTERAQDLGEVFTPQNIVDEMLSLLGPAVEDPELSVFEPSCGNGNFLVGVLERRLRQLSRAEFTPLTLGVALISCATRLYGVDIDSNNVLECRNRLGQVFKKSLIAFSNSEREKLLKSVNGVFATNIVQGDSLNGADSILLVEYELINSETFRRNLFFLKDPERDLFFQDPEPLQDRHYLELNN